MALSSRAKTNSRGSKLIASNGNKRKRDGTSDIQSKPISKKRTGSDSVLAVPSKQTDCQKALEEAKIVKEFRITFHPRKFDPQRPGNVPEEHQTKFRHIQQLGQISYDSYALQPRPDTANKPWELENKLRATRVSARAIQARNEYQNEDGWRTKLDNLVFERFEIEVACQECRKRRWQSFVEVNPEESNSRTKNLAERQHRRTVCDCKPSSKQYSILSTGLTDMFTTRIGERSVIQDDPENHRRIEMRPDRIYGLNTTDTIRNILEQPHVSHLKEVSELDDDLQGRLTVSCNPDSGGEVSIYPFLVMEAKSLKSGTTFPDIETQTAVPIRNHLYLQLKLQDDKFNNMPTPGGPLTWFLAYVGETWRVYGCYVTKSSPGNSPCYEIVRLWQGDITGYDEALQLVLIMDYIVDWARDIFRPSIMRQLMSVVDKGEQSSYTIVDQPDILSIHDPANSRYGGRPVPTIAGAGTFEAPAESAFDAVHSTISSSFEPLFESTGKHVDIKVWESAKYESRVRGLFITEHDSAAMKHLTTYGYKRLETVYMSRCWFLLPNSKDIRTIEEAWTGSTPAEIKDVSDPSEQKILISLYVQFRNDEFGAPIRELTYLAFTGSVVKQMRYERDINGILERDELVASPEVLGLKLSEAWTSSHNNYFQRYASGEISVLRVTASDHDKMSDSVSLSFLNDRDTTNYARRLDSFIKNICEHPRANLHKVYAPCFRYTKVVHSLTVKPHCILDPTQACVFINAKAMPSGICIYAKNGASEKTNHEWVIRHLVQIVVVLWDSQWPDTKGSFYIRRYMFESHYIDSKILLWIVSDPQWDLYTAMKPSLTMPGTERVHEHLAWFRKVLLTHKCGTGTIRSNVTGCGAHRAGYRNVQRHIQEACKKCDYDTSFVAPKFPFCDEDFMPGGFDGNLKESSVH